MRLLLLAGTAEARALAERLAERPAGPAIAVTASLAGRTAAPAKYPVAVRTGGFGGAAGLAGYLRETGTGAVVDATHPFASRMQANAARAAAATATPLVRLARPPWVPEPGDRWTCLADAAAAAAALPAGARAFLALGAGGGLAPFLARPDVTLHLRAAESPDPPPVHPALTVIRARPPFEVAAETGLLARLAITHLVARNAGGSADAKLWAARALALPVLMIARPAGPEGVETVGSVEAAAAWVRATAAAHGRAGSSAHRKPHGEIPW